MIALARRAMPQYVTPGTVTAALFAIAGVALLVNPALLAGLGQTLSISASPDRWQELEVDASGVLVKTVNNPFGILPLLAMTVASVLVAALAAMKLVATVRGGASTGKLTEAQIKDAGEKVERELAAIATLLASYLKTNASYSEALVRAQRALPELVKPEQIKALVRLLLDENERVQRDAADLKSKLQQSSAQIENLRTHLSEAQALGMRDPLTNVGNRRAFDMALAHEVSSASAAGMCLVMGDIDHFKRVNDGFGHLVGDEILKMFAKLLSDNVKGRDTVARYGGEEFALILPDTEVQNAASLAERIRGQFESKNLVVNKSGQKLGRMTASFGVAQLREGDTPEALFQRADARLYEAKCTGRNRVVSK